MSQLHEKPSALKREHPALRKMKVRYQLFSMFVGHFCPSGSESGLRIRIQGTHWIRIHSTGCWSGIGRVAGCLGPLPWKDEGSVLWADVERLCSCVAGAGRGWRRTDSWAASDRTAPAAPAVTDTGEWHSFFSKKYGIYLKKKKK